MIKSVKDLKAYEDVFTLIDECTDNYVFVYDLENDLFHISKSALDTFTLEEEHIKLASSALKPLVYPKDWDRLAADIRAVRNQEKAQHNLEYRLITKDDEIIWVSGKSRTFFNENGEPFMLIGCICEIGKHNKYDNITSLYCEDVLKERYALAKIAEPQPVTGTILLIGIDNFREINEKYGTKMGNILLAGVAEAIAVCCKNRENVFRFHGDEFAVILKEQPSCTTADAKKLYKTIRRKIDSSIEKNGYHMFFTISGGAASFNTQEDSYEDVLKNAKFALHVSKLNGKNTFTPYSEDEYLSYIRRIDIQEELKKLPGKPGVYLMHDETDKIIYVGKAISLKNRVRQYFQSSRNKGAKIEQMVTHISRFEYIVTDSELEALVLECNLIKEHRPKYNTMLMDDKAYPFIKVTVQEPFPRVMLARRVQKDKAKYFGPYTSAGAVKDTIELIRKLYFIRSCNRRLPKDIGKERPCLNYHIHQCKAPCQGYISKEEYRKSVEEVLHFLNGNYDPILEKLKAQMEEASESLEFERAIEYRELINSVQKIAQKQKITDTAGDDRDIVAVSKDLEDAVVQVFFIRNGRLIGRDHFYLKLVDKETKAEILSSFIKQFYAGTPYIPGQIMLPEEIPDHEIIEEWLTRKKEHKVHLVIPKKGTKEKLVELAEKNARMVLTKDKERIKREEGRTIGAVKELQNLLGLTGLHRMEAYDISNTNGFESVGSMVVYEKGKPKRNDYRKFKIKGVKGANDYASMNEVLTRRFGHGLREKEEGRELGSFTVFPDLILMDGGKGQVNIALEVLDKLNLDIPVCGMVKDDHHRTRGLYYHNEEIPIDRNSEAFRLITRIQDEAHRFAITFHRQLRSQGQVHSILDDIPGVGPARRKDLMKHFANIEAIKNATVEELKSLPSMNEKSAKDVYDFFH